MSREKKKTYLLVGIGGIGMSALGILLRQSGNRIVGIDKNPTDFVEGLKGQGIEIIRSEEEIEWSRIDEVIHSSAVLPGSPILAAAKQKGIPVTRRGEKLSSVLDESPCSVGITGAHGKTTTTTLLSHILISSGRKIQAYLGGISNNYHSNYLHTGRDYFVAEIDESDRTIEKMRPTEIIITNIEYEHVDQYPAVEDLLKTYKTFLLHAKKEGKIFYREDDPYVPALMKALNKKGTAVSRDPESGAPVSFFWDEQKLSGRIGIEKNDFEIKNPALYGWHNMENAALAAACAYGLGVTPGDIAKAMGSFTGVKRRFERIGLYRQTVQCISDYAHHPTELKKTLSIAKEIFKKGKICAVFQPHRFSRFSFFFNDFAEALEAADAVVVTEIYLSGEQGDVFHLPQKLVEKLNSGCGGKAHFASLGNLESMLLNVTEGCEAILFLGAGSLDAFARNIVRQYEKN
jgi:UDP-N-acetylmuramate--alanine ligase